MKTQAVVFAAKEKIEMREVDLPPLGEDQMLTKTIYTFVSPGTELRVLSGCYGSEDHFPFVPGYAVISRVIKVGSAVKNFRVGDAISSCWVGKFENVQSYWGGQSAYHVYTANPEFHVLLPELNDEELLPYVITEVAAISFRGMCLAAPQKEDHVLVIGQGMIGRFSAEFFRISGASVTVGDIDKNRLRDAESYGFTAVDLSDENAAERLSCCSRNKYDIVVECSGTSAGLKLAYSQLRVPPREVPNRYIKNVPKLVLQASYIENISIEPANFFKAEGVMLITPYDREFEDRKLVSELIRTKKIDTSGYVRNIFTVDGFIEAYRKLQSHEISSAVFKWN